MPNFTNLIKLSNLHMIVLIVSLLISFSIGKPQNTDDFITKLKNDNNLMNSQKQLQRRWTFRSPTQMNIEINMYNNLQNANNNEIYPEIRTDQTLDSEICLTYQIQEKCHTCSQREFQLNLDECAKTHQIEKISCFDEDNRETILIRSCGEDEQMDGSYSFGDKVRDLFSNLIEFFRKI